jgi:hypothetical protein
MATTIKAVVSDKKMIKDKMADSLWLRGNMTSSSSPRFLSVSTCITNILVPWIPVGPLINMICCYTIQRQSSRILLLGRVNDNDYPWRPSLPHAIAFSPFHDIDDDYDDNDKGIYVGLPNKHQSGRSIPAMDLPCDRIFPVRINNRYLLACAPQVMWMFDMMDMKWSHIPFESIKQQSGAMALTGRPINTGNGSSLPIDIVGAHIVTQNHSGDSTSSNSDERISNEHANDGPRYLHIMSNLTCRVGKSMVNYRNHHIIPLESFESTWLQATESKPMTAPQLMHQWTLNGILEGPMIVGEKDHVWYSCSRSRFDSSSSVPTSRLVMVPPKSPALPASTTSSPSSSSSNWVETTRDLNYERSEHAVLNIPGYGIVVAGGRQSTYDICDMEYYPFNQHITDAHNTSSRRNNRNSRNSRTTSSSPSSRNNGWLRLAMRLPRLAMIRHQMVVCEDHIIVLGRELKHEEDEIIKGPLCAWSLPIATLMSTVLPKMNKYEEGEVKKPDSSSSSFSLSPRVIEYRRAMAIAEANVWKKLASFGTGFQCDGVVVID